MLEMNASPQRNGNQPPPLYAQISAVKKDLTSMETLLIHPTNDNMLDVSKELLSVVLHAQVFWNSTNMKMLACLKENI